VAYHNDQMDKPRMTRRSWAAIVAAAPLAAQVTSTPQTPPLSAPEPDKAAAEVRKISDRLAQTEVPMAVEPAFSFRA
jgi:hypothetical protein